LDFPTARGSFDSVLCFDNDDYFSLPSFRDFDVDHFQLPSFLDSISFSLGSRDLSQLFQSLSDFFLFVPADPIL